MRQRKVFVGIQPRHQSASDTPNCRACSRTQTGMRVRTMHGSPPQTPVRLSMPGTAPLKSFTVQRSNCAFSAGESLARISSAVSNVLIARWQSSANGFGEQDCSQPCSEANRRRAVAKANNSIFRRNEAGDATLFMQKVFAIWRTATDNLSRRA